LRVVVFAVKNLIDQVDLGLQRRDVSFVKRIFARYSEGRPFLTSQELSSALNELGIDIEREDTMALFAATKCGEHVTAEEFLQLTRKLFKSNEWSGLLELHELLLDCLPKTSGQHPLIVISEFSSFEISCVCEAYCHGLKKTLKELSCQLKRAFKLNKANKTGLHMENDDNDVDSKVFMMPPEPELTGATEMKETLDTLLRSQFCLAQEPASVIFGHMETEHCNKPDSNMVFKGSSTPRKEWDIVMECSREVYEVDRIIPEINDLAMSKCGSLLTREEIISVVLYTGPMVRIILFIFCKLFQFIG
jgi:hypothetical protein